MAAVLGKCVACLLTSVCADIKTRNLGKRIRTGNQSQVHIQRAQKWQSSLHLSLEVERRKKKSSIRRKIPKEKINKTHPSLCKSPTDLSFLFSKWEDSEASLSHTEHWPCSITYTTCSIFITANMAKMDLFSDKHELRERNDFERLWPKSVIFLC